MRHRNRPLRKAAFWLAVVVFVVLGYFAIDMAAQEASELPSVGRWFGR
jgi:quinol-cytochrome oxidoreductase complex cytochrome b subunit